MMLYAQYSWVMCCYIHAREVESVLKTNPLYSTVELL